MKHSTNPFPLPTCTQDYVSPPPGGKKRLKEGDEGTHHWYCCKRGSSGSQLIFLSVCVSIQAFILTCPLSICGGQDHRITNLMFVFVYHISLLPQWPRKELGVSKMLLAFISVSAVPRCVQHKKLDRRSSEGDT